jgi:uncharacterized protein (TIGR02246 family)
MRTKTSGLVALALSIVVVLKASPCGAQLITAATAADEKAIRATADEFVKAFNAGDAKTIGAEWSSDAEYTEETGQDFHGRAAIEAYYAQLFKEHPGGVITIKIESIRSLGPDIAVEKGIASVKDPKGDSSAAKYTVVHARRDGKWVMVDCKDAPYVSAADEDYLKDLGWLIGDWKIDAKLPNEERRLKFEWLAGKNFIKSNFTVVKDGKTALAGGQIIGWHPKRGQIVSMHFDANGGFGNDAWIKDGSKWVIEASGVFRDGSDTTAVNVLTQIDDNNFTWQSVKRTLDGVKLPDTPPVKVTRVQSAK